MEIKFNRREFMRFITWASTVLLPATSFGGNKQTHMSATVPRQAFGNSGVKISKLCFGAGSFVDADFIDPDSEALLDEALNYGVDCWESGLLAGKAYSEYFKKHPGIREKVFLTGKVSSTNPTVMQEQLEKILHENGTSFIDFLAIHAIDNIEVLNDDVRKWVEKVKKQKKIRFFGFCTHKNMDHCLSCGAELGWIDGIQTVYNYRLKKVKSMEDALWKCHEKGIGIFAIKSMGLCVQKKTDLHKLPLNREKLNVLLTDHNMTFEQAKLKAIWQNSNLTSVCSLMPDSEILKSNITAAMDERPLNAEIEKLLADYTDSTGRFYCRRCGICETVNTNEIPVFGIMEMLMYARGYGDGACAWIEKKFTQDIPFEIRDKINSSDYSIAEKICPQRMPIAQLMKEAYKEFSK